jgi:hypothetical protein
MVYPRREAPVVSASSLFGIGAAGDQPTLFPATYDARLARQELANSSRKTENSEGLTHPRAYLIRGRPAPRMRKCVVV